MKVDLHANILSVKKFLFQVCMYGSMFASFDCNHFCFRELLAWLCSCWDQTNRGQPTGHACNKSLLS